MRVLLICLYIFLALFCNSYFSQALTDKEKERIEQIWYSIIPVQAYDCLGLRDAASCLQDKLDEASDRKWPFPKYVYFNNGSYRLESPLHIGNYQGLTLSHGILEPITKEPALSYE